MTVGVGKTASMKWERDEAKEEAQLTRLAVVSVGDEMALSEDKMARVGLRCPSGCRGG